MGAVWLFFFFFFLGEMMLIWEGKVHINQLVRLWDQRHTVVVLDHLVFLYLLFTS